MKKQKKFKTLNKDFPPEKGVKSECYTRILVSKPDKNGNTRCYSETVG